MEGSLLDEEMKIIRSDPQLLTRRGEVLMNEMNAMENEQANQQESMVEEEEEEEETLEIDKKYNNMREIRLAAIEYGRRRKFAVSTLRSGARQLVLACKHSGSYRGTKKTVTEEQNTTEAGNRLPVIALQQVEEEEESTPQKKTRKKVSRKIECPFQIRAKPIKGNQWIVYKMVLEHNHPMAVDSKAYAQHRKLDEETQKLIVRLMRSGSTNTMIVKYLSLKGIRNVVRKDIANIRQTYFNPNNNKISATGKILYQAEQIDSQQQQQAEQVNMQENELYQPLQIDMQVGQNASYQPEQIESYQPEQINMQENESSVAIQTRKVLEAMEALKQEENQ
ncbi:hypothetical protein MFLAVUS_002331 [Mucor flavus]|uniref:FAR1 domain-containing protein n=1 Tax=Mucor flavus TaxID=439312 RepID=A0ABP9YPZ4_9FUNG